MGDGNAGTTHLQPLFDDGALEEVRNQANELVLQLSQLDKGFNAAIESNHTTKNNLEELRENVLQEMNSVKRELEMCVSQTTDCQRALQKLKTEMPAESFQCQENVKVHANLVNSDSLERQQLARFVNSTLKAKV